MKHSHRFFRLPDRVRRVLCALCILLGSALLLAALAQMLESYTARQQNDSLKALYYGTTGLIAYAEAPEPDPTPEPENAGFEELQKINPDIVGWIKGGSMVDTPVVHRDNQYYMTHDFYGRESASGTVFADVRNTNCAADPYVILYGHNMKDGSMFGTLPRYRTLSYLKANPILEFTTTSDSAPVYYVPIAVFDASMEQGDDNYFYLRQYLAFSKTQARQQFLDEIRARSLFNIPVDVNTSDRILALVTCSYADTNGRFILFCRPLRANETQDGVRALLQSAAEK